VRAREALPTPTPTTGDQERSGAPNPDPYTAGDREISGRAWVDRERFGQCAGVSGRISLPLSLSLSPDLFLAGFRWLPDLCDVAVAVWLEKI
jgi:hypothetical protein